MWVIWQESCILWHLCPPATTVTWDNSLANVAVCVCVYVRASFFFSFSFFLFFVCGNLGYRLVGTWGCYSSCLSIGIGSLNSILRLCRIMDISYCMAMMLISLIVYLVFSSRILNVVSILYT